MKKKNIIILSTTLIVVLAVYSVKDFIFKNLIEARVKHTYKESSIGFAKINIFNNSFVLKDINLKKENVHISSIEGSINLVDLLINSPTLYFKNLTFNDINLNTNSNDNKIRPKNKTGVYFSKELEKYLYNEKGITSFNSATAASLKSTKDIINFLAKNSNYMDDIIAEEFNIVFKEKVIDYSEKLKSGLHHLKDSNFNIVVTNLSFSLKDDNNILIGEVKNLDTSDDLLTPTTFNLHSKNDGFEIVSHGSIDLDTFTSDIYVKLINLQLKDISLYPYFKSGTIDTEQFVYIDGSGIIINGLSTIYNPQLKKEIFYNSSLKQVKKDIFYYSANILNNESTQFQFINKYSSRNGTIELQTDFSKEFKKALLNNQESFQTNLMKSLDLYYSNNGFNNKITNTVSKNIF